MGLMGTSTWTAFRVMQHEGQMQPTIFERLLESGSKRSTWLDRQGEY